MSFDLINVGATFQRAMDVAFKEYIDKFMVVYQDDLSAYSKRVEEPCKHLENILIKSLEYDVSLNPKKCIFGVIEGIFLGHIVSKDGVKTNPKRAVEIDKVPKPKNVKGIQ